MSPDFVSRRRRLFLSYGHRDAMDLALRLRTGLEAAGYSVWQDEQRIRAGRAWTDEIRQGLRESDLVIALLSPHAVRRRGWDTSPDDQDSVCLDEVEYAIDACRIPVLPVMAVPCEPPFRIYRLQYLDLREWQESRARYDALERMVLDGVAECLAAGRAPLRKWERLPEPWDFTAFLAERRRWFTGRTWLFDALRDRLAHGTNPLIVLTGAPGIGKSAFFASLVHSNPEGRILAYHCCQDTSPATLSPAVFVRSLAAMISARDAGYAAMLEHADTLAALDEARVTADPASAFERVVLNLLHKLPVPEAPPRLLLIDALDEALAWSGPLNLVDLLSSRVGALPGWLKIVATTRDDPRVKRRFRAADLLPIDSAARDNEADLRGYVRMRLEAEPLYTKAGAQRQEIGRKVLARGTGNFLVVSQTLDAVESGLMSADDLDTLAPGLHPLYEGFFDRIYRRAGVDFAPSRTMLQSLVAAQEPPSRAQLAAVTGLDAEADLPPILARLASMVPPRDGRYSLFHKTLAEWLTGWHAEEDQPVAGEYYVSSQSGHRRWADALLQRHARGSAAWDAPLRRHIATHLVGAERWARTCRRASRHSFCRSHGRESGHDCLRPRGRIRHRRAKSARDTREASPHRSGSRDTPARCGVPRPVSREPVSMPLEPRLLARWPECQGVLHRAGWLAPTLGSGRAQAERARRALAGQQGGSLPARCLASHPSSASRNARNRATRHHPGAQRQLRYGHGLA
jgi:hypothetical protein